MLRKPDNFLEWIPLVSERNSWELNENGLVTIHMSHRGFFAWIAHQFFHRPRISHIALDTMGSFIFRNIDGQRTVGAIAELVHREFGTDAEPLYSRLITYLQILRNNGFIRYVKPDQPA